MDMISEVRDFFENHPRAEWLIPAVLCLIFMAQLLLSVRQLSQTADEATHLYAGYRYLKCGDETFSGEHPPLARLVAVLPLLPRHPPVNCTPVWPDAVKQATAAQAWFYSQDWRAVLFQSRMAVSVFALGLCILVWVMARRMFGLGTAVLATLLLVFEPNILANGALVMTDTVVTALLPLAVFSFYLWCCRHSRWLVLFSGIALGLTLLAKHSGLIAVPSLVILAIVDPSLRNPAIRRGGKEIFRNLVAVGIMCAVAVPVIWTGYGWHYDLTPAREPAATHVLLFVEKTHLLPLAYVEGIAALKQIPASSAPVFILGKVYPSGQWFFYPLNLLIRCTVATLAALLLACGGIVLGFKLRSREYLFLLIPAAIFIALCIRSTVSGGIRYVLPVLPFLLIAGAAGILELAKRVQWMKYVVPGLLILHAASSLRAFPNYLSYANELWGGPTKTYQYLPWIDAGQSYWQVRQYTESHTSEDCWVLTKWQWDPEIYVPRCKAFSYWKGKPISPSMRGTVFVSSSLLTTTNPAEVLGAESFRGITPTDTIGGSAMLVYKGDFDTRGAASMGAIGGVEIAISSRHLAEALELSDYSIQMSPRHFFPHYCRSVVLSKLGRRDAALQELEVARSLLAGDPLRTLELRLAGEVQRGLDRTSRIPR